jgi:hypothetical protein
MHDTSSASDEFSGQVSDSSDNLLGSSLLSSILREPLSGFQSLESSTDRASSDADDSSGVASDSSDIGGSSLLSSSPGSGLSDSESFGVATGDGVSVIAHRPSSFRPSFAPDVIDSTASTSLGLQSFPFTDSERYGDDSSGDRGNSRSPIVWIGIGVAIGALILIALAIFIIVLVKRESETEAPEAEFESETGLVEQSTSWLETPDTMECENPIGVTVDQNVDFDACDVDEESGESTRTAPGGETRLG